MNKIKSFNKFQELSRKKDKRRYRSYVRRSLNKYYTNEVYFSDKIKNKRISVNYLDISINYMFELDDFSGIKNNTKLLQEFYLYKTVLKINSNIAYLLEYKEYVEKELDIISSGRVFIDSFFNYFHNENLKNILEKIESLLLKLKLEQNLSNENIVKKNNKI